MPPGPTVLRLFLLDEGSPGLPKLRAALPPHVATPLGLEIPLGEYGPEEILALCLQFGVTARATRIGAPSSAFLHDGFKPTSRLRPFIGTRITSEEPCLGTSESLIESSGS